MKFTWDPRKAASNLRKHGVSFDEASTVFADALSATISDPAPSVSIGSLQWEYHHQVGFWSFATPKRPLQSALSARVAPHAMKKTATKAEKHRDTMRPEYDFSNAVRGKYHRAYQQSTNIVVLEPDVARRFKNSRAVNEALRAVLKAADQTQA